LCHMPCPSHPTWLDHSNYTWRRVQVMMFISSLFGLNILLSTLDSNTLSLCCSLNIRDQVSQPYRTTGKTVVLYILIFVLKQQTRRQNTLDSVNSGRC
jgi:hypothetical protein